MDEVKKCPNCENSECQGCGGSIKEKKEGVCTTKGEGKACETKPENPATPE
jgi:hypothetical protein